MTNVFKIAVIVPTYNLEKIINRTMDNLVRQYGIDDMEVVVIDDGSSDKTLSIVQGYEGKIKNLTIKSFSTPSGGASRARNIGIELSNSEYISFLDGDDYYGENALITAYQHMKNANANIGDLKVVSENRGQGISYPDNLVHYDLDVINDRQYRIMGPWKIYKSDLIKVNKITFDESIHVGEDRVFNVHAYIHSQNKIIALFDKDYYHLTGGEHEHVTDRLTNNSLNDIYDFFEAILELTSHSHDKVSDSWVYKFRMGFVDKTQANKWHYKILNNNKLSYQFRNKVFDEGKRILSKYLNNSDLDYLKEYFPKWSWFTETMMEHDFSFFNYVNKKMNYLASARNYGDSYIENTRLMTVFGQKKGQFMEANISHLDGIELSIQKFDLNSESVLNIAMIANSRLISEDFKVSFVLDDNEGGMISFNSGDNFSQKLLSKKDQIYFVKILLQNDDYKIMRNIKLEDFAFDFKEIFGQMNNYFDGEMKIHFYASGVNNIKVRIKEAK